MNELIDDTKSILLWLLGGVMALLSWIGRRQVRRIDQLEASSVTREELVRTIAQMRDDRQQMHNENKEEFRYIRNRLDGIADRQ